MADQTKNDVAPIAEEASSIPVPDTSSMSVPPLAATPSAAPEATPPTPEPIPVEAPTSPAPSPIESAAPVMVTQAEVKPNATQEERLGEEVEILTGEIQALEAKIEGMTAGAQESNETSSPASVIPPAPMPTDQAPIAAEISQPTSEPMETTDKPDEKTEAKGEDLAAAALPPMPKTDETPKPEIKESKTEEVSSPLPTNSQPLNDGPDVEEPVSAVGIVGEVFGVIGIVLLVVMILSPFYKDFIGADLFNSVKSTGWLVTVIALALGFLLSLFNRGKSSLKFGLFFFLVVALIIYLGIGSSSIADALNTYLGPLLGYYR